MQTQFKALTNQERASARDIKFALDNINAEIRQLQEERGKIKGRIKAELNWKVADFNFACRLADLEQLDRDEALDVIRKVFTSLDIGMQGSLFAGLDAAPDQGATPAEDNVVPLKKKRGRPTKAEQIAAAVLADAQPSAEEAEADRQRAEDEQAFDGDAGEDGEDVPLEDVAE